VFAEGSPLLLTGPGGIGKTCLAGEIAQASPVVERIVASPVTQGSRLGSLAAVGFPSGVDSAEVGTMFQSYLRRWRSPGRLRRTVLRVDDVQHADPNPTPTGSWRRSQPAPGISPTRTIGEHLRELTDPRHRRYGRPARSGRRSRSSPRPIRRRWSGCCPRNRRHVAPARRLGPVRPDPDRAEIRLARAAVLDIEGGRRTVESRAALLGDPTRPLLIPEEEVPCEGAVVRRSFQAARWHDGRLFVWLTHRKSVGRGEGSSGLRFDSLSE
jgi:hypothetical protein